MKSVFDNLQNTPFGDLSKGVLNTDVLKGNVLDVINPLKNTFNPTKDEYFYSCGYNTGLRRYYQSLEEGEEVYGMECNATTLMYMLQSCGLITAKMSRKDFEYIFTPLNPYYIGKDKANDIKAKDTNRKIVIDGLVLADAKPEDLFSKIFDPNFPTITKENTGLNFFEKGKSYPIPITCAILRGAKQVPDKYPKLVNNLESILNTFKMFPEEFSNYSFMKNIHRAIIKPDFIVNSFYTGLLNNTINKSYFEKGGSIFCGVSLNYPSRELEHYCLITREAFPAAYLIDSYRQKHYYYPADDALFGHTYVLAPAVYEPFEVLKKLNRDLQYNEGLFFNGRYVHNLASQLSQGISL